MERRGQSGDALPQLKATTFSDHYILRQRLIDAGLYGQNKQADRFYDKFTDLLSERELVGYGINLSWDIANWYTESMEGSLGDPSHPNYGTIVELLVDDPEVAVQSQVIRISMLLGTVPQYDNSQLKKLAAEKIEIEKTERARLTAEKEKQAALQIREMSTRLLIDNSFQREFFSLTQNEDGVINAISHRAWTLSDEDFKEWEDYVRVNPNDTIEIGYKDLELDTSIEGPQMNPFSLDNSGAVDSLVEILTRYAQKTT